MLETGVIQAIVTGSHKCRCTWTDEGVSVGCSHMLWAREAPVAVQKLTEQRRSFLLLDNRARART
eukprot:5430533-Pleurochrysis_carterae.AAC.1